jgi:succinate dehydrogenase / fumarate reductase cytochrome b subunit
MADTTLCRFMRSTLGLKGVMALSGAVLTGFVAVHMAGNLLVFAGPEKMDAYAAMLKASPAVLWGARIFLLASVVAHGASAVILARRSRAEARPVPYAVKGNHGSTYAARTMILGGPLLAAFIVYHLLHYTVGTVHPNFAAHKVFNNVVIGFSNPLVVLVYLVAMAALCAHLGHGVWSMLQTLGVNRPHWEKALRLGSIAFGVAVAAGFSAVPLAVLVGLVKLVK